MNSQELEQSLKAEFESHLNSVIAEMKQEIAEFQRQIQSELEQQRARTEEAFQGFSQRVESKGGLAGGFGELVAEYLKLARDEGARLAATAYSEAEMIGRDQTAETPQQGAPQAVPANYAGLRNAVAEISSKNSQATILGTLVDHASEFASRGAFFIVKNERFVGWRTFGPDADDDAVKGISLSWSEDSILGEACAATNTVEAAYGEHGADDQFLTPIQFGQPERMYAVPLVVRGRSVAILYADGEANVEALETLVRVAAMTVELLASGQAAAEAQAPAAAPQPEAVEETEQAVSEEAPAAEAVPEPEVVAEQTEDEAVPEPVAAGEEAPAAEESQPVEAEFEAEQPFVSPEVAEVEHAFGSDEPIHAEAGDEAASIASEEAVAEEHEVPAFFQEPLAEEQGDVGFEQPEYKAEEGDDAVSTPSFEPAISFDSPSSLDTVSEPVQSPFERTGNAFEPAAPVGAGIGTHVLDHAVEVATPPAPRSRLSDRNVDLPIEVAEEDRRMHNDARRFARLLVSEIKLYNEKKVLEGRQASDLYGRLKEAIDRSREMYDKRVQPPVAAKFDYFHYELVNSLAEGDAGKFGAGYPGASV